MKSSRGFTLVELVLSIVVMGIALLSLLSVFTQMSVGMQAGEQRRVARMLVQEQLEEIRARRFDEGASKDVNGNWSSPLGADAGESTTDRTTLDDVDDFDGLSETLTGDFAGFTRTVSVSYVSQNSPDTPLAIPSPISANWTPNYKRILVTCSNTQANVQMVLLIGQAQRGG